MAKDSPLSTEEIREAADLFFESFAVIRTGMPDGSTTEDTLKVLEYVAKLAIKMRIDREREKLSRFGFSKKEEAVA
jgi:hypothetical protein